MMVGWGGGVGKHLMKYTIHPWRPKGMGIGVRVNTTQARLDFSFFIFIHTSLQTFFWLVTQSFLPDVG